MTAPSSPHANVSVNRWLVNKLEAWLEANSEVRTPFGRTKSDVLNLLMIQFLIQVANDIEINTTRLEHLSENKEAYETQRDLLLHRIQDIEAQIEMLQSQHAQFAQMVRDKDKIIETQFVRPMLEDFKPVIADQKSRIRLLERAFRGHRKPNVFFNYERSHFLFFQDYSHYIDHAYPGSPQYTPSFKDYLYMLVMQSISIPIPKCSVCNETHKSLLHIDHIQNDGNIDRLIFGSDLRMWLYYVTYPKEAEARLQILCHNHNLQKQRKRSRHYKNRYEYEFPKEKKEG